MIASTPSAFVSCQAEQSSAKLHQNSITPRLTLLDSVTHDHLGEVHRHALGSTVGGGTAPAKGSASFAASWDGNARSGDRGLDESRDEGKVEHIWKSFYERDGRLRGFIVSSKAGRQGGGTHGFDRRNAHEGERAIAWIKRSGWREQESTVDTHE